MSHAREINGFLRRRGHSAAAADDLTQDTFIRLMTSAPVQNTDNPRAYLHKVARNLSIDLYRRERLIEHVDLTEDDLGRIADRTPGPESIVYDKQRLAIVERALLELPENTRRAFEMHRLGEQTMGEVAAELGVSVSRTWVLIRRAYLHLRNRLHEDMP